MNNNTSFRGMLVFNLHTYSTTIFEGSNHFLVFRTKIFLNNKILQFSIAKLQYNLKFSTKTKIGREMGNDKKEIKKNIRKQYLINYNRKNLTCYFIP